MHLVHDTFFDGFEVHDLSENDHPPIRNMSELPNPSAKRTGHPPKPTA